jgi:hypothetical protein
VSIIKLAAIFIARGFTAIRQTESSTVQIMRLAVKTLCLMCLYFCSPLAFANENFVAGIYQDTTGNQYLVTGAAPSQTGRAQWSITSTTPKPGTTNTFNAIWETGAAVGNTYLAGNSNVPNNTAGYTNGRSYGVTSNNNWGWGTGSVISVGQVGTTLLISLLYSDGTTNSSQTLSCLSGCTVSTVSTVSRTDCIFNWAEQNYAQYFSPAGATDATLSPYTYRHYSATGNYLAISSADNHLWVMGSVFGGLLDVGPVTSFLAPSGCQ